MLQLIRVVHNKTTRMSAEQLCDVIKYVEIWLRQQVVEGTDF